MNIFTKAMTMNLNMSTKNIMDRIVAEIDTSFVEVKNVDKRNSVVVVSLLDLMEFVHMLFYPMSI